MNACIMIEEPVLLVKPAAVPRTHHVGLEIIALLKLFQGLLVLLIGVGALSLLDRELQQTVKDWGSDLLLRSDHRFLSLLLHKLAGISKHSLLIASGVAFFYAALLFVEGIGLWLEKTWAEYLTVIVTASFIPFEIYELVRRATLIKAGVIAINVAVVWYLVVLLLKSRQRRNGGVATRAESA